MEKNAEEVALLVAQTGPLNGQRWALRRSILLGRDSTCDIAIDDRQISRHHARLNVTKDGIILEDLSSKNGTLCNGQVIQGTTLLQDGDVIQIALAQKFVFISSDATVPLEAQEATLSSGASMSDQAVEQAPAGRLRLDKRSRRVWVQVGEKGEPAREEEILPPLSVSQFRLLQLLYENQGRVVSRYELVTTVWGEAQAFEVSEQALDALVRRLRERIGNIDPEQPYIITVRGHGLRLDNPPLA